MSYRVRSHKFCCCIPVRFGTCVSAILGLAAGGLVTIGGAIQLTRGGESINKLSIGIQIGVYALLAIVSICGLIGCLARKEGAVKAYWGVLIVHLFFSIGTGAFFLYNLFKDTDKYVDECMKTADNDGTIVRKTCEGGLALMKGIMIAVLVVIWLLQLWGCFIVRSYVWQLREEKAADEKAARV